MMKRIARWLCLFFFVGIWLWPVSVHAAPLDKDREGSIALYYSHEGEGFENLEIEIYRVAEVISDTAECRVTLKLS